MCANIPEENPESSALDNSTAVCGTNGVTYPSLCQFIQDTGNEAVAYAGPCDRRECQGGPVSEQYIGGGGGMKTSTNSH